MAKQQTIDVGRRGNDGTGDTIREAFKKINSNFTDLYAVFGVSGTISSTDLADFPQYTRDQIFIANSTGSKILSKNLSAGPGINIDLTNASTITISSTFGSTLNTDEVTEGVINKYFSNTLARDAFSAGTGLSYDANTGIFSSTITEYTDSRARTAISGGVGIDYNSTTGVITNNITAGAGISYNNTTGIISSTITQYTDAMAQSAITVTDAGGDGSLTYSNGQITYTGPSATEVRSHFTAGTGITIDSGCISSSVTQYSDSLARQSISGGTGISYSNTNGVICSTITQYTDALARATISYCNTPNSGYGSISYTSGTGIITYTPVTSTEVRGAISAGTGISYSNTTGVICSTITQYTDSQARQALSGGTGISYSNSTGVICSTITQYTDALARSSISYCNTPNSGYGSISYASATGVMTYTPVTSTEVRGALSGGTGISYSNSTGVICSTITQYTDSLARASISACNVPNSGYGSITYTSSTGLIAYTPVTSSDIRGTLSAGTGISYSNSTGVICSTITQYTDALARASICAGTGISYNNTTGAICSTITQYTDSLARASISQGTGICYSSTNGIICTNLSGSSGVSVSGASISLTNTPSTTSTANTTVLRDSSADIYGHIFHGNFSASVTSLTVDSGDLAYTSSTLTDIITAELGNGNGLQIQLPVASTTIGRSLVIINRSSSSRDLTILDSNNNTLTTVLAGGATTPDVKRLICDGTSWLVI